MSNMPMIDETDVAVVAKLIADVDEILDEGIANFESLLTWHGATDEEFAREMELAERARIEARTKLLAEMKSLLLSGQRTQ